MVNGLPQKNAKIQIHIDKAWKDFTGDLILPDNKNIDIAFFTLLQPTTNASTVELGDTVTFGKEGYFFGYPYGLHTDVDGEYLPFIKKLSVSATAQTGSPSPFLYLDGFNNPGFSGGPVAFYDYQKQKWEIVAVISGFQPEQAWKKVGGKYVPPSTLVNSGIIIAYFIDPAIKTLDKYIADQK